MSHTPLTRLRSLIDSMYDGNQAKFARAIQRSAAQVHQWLHEIRGFGGASQRHIELSLGLPAGWFTNGEPLDAQFLRDTELGSAASSWPPLESAPPPSQSNDGFAIHQIDTGGRMGNGGLVLRDQPGVIRAWHVSQEWIQQNVHRITSPANLAIVTGFGDSMRPLYNPGDPLLVDAGRKRVDVDGIYFFRVGEEGFIKRLQRIPTAQGTVIRAKSENPAYDPFEITSGMDFEVFGWVVKAWRGEDF